MNPSVHMMNSTGNNDRSGGSKHWLHAFMVLNEGLGDSRQLAFMHQMPRLDGISVCLELPMTARAVELSSHANGKVSIVTVLLHLTQ